MKKYKLISIIAVALLISSCTAHNYDLTVTEHPHGFWFGFWHGMISPITLIWHIFDNSVVVWDVNNNGNWYAFGFLWGAGVLTGTASRSTK